MSEEPNYAELFEKSLVKLKAAREKIAVLESGKTKPIAIIGMAGRFPGAKNINEFFDNILKGVESITFFSDTELLESGITEDEFNKPNYVKAKGVMQDFDYFDASFFGMNPKKAEMTDPQIRLFLETAWTAMEDAGYCSEVQAGKISVFAGMTSYYNHFEYLEKFLGPFKSSADFFQVVINNAADFLSTIVSYHFNLTGPSLTLQTACSTSLIAVIEGCTHLLNHTCDMALAGGVCISIPMNKGYTYQEGSILSPDGHCRPLDIAGNGTVPGNGVGIVVLKRYEDAVRDKDQIYAVIQGFASNNDGSHKVGYTAPGLEGQMKAIEEALSKASIHPEQISLYEAHATATPLGDPIEIEAATKAYRKYTTKKQFIPLGSVKGNVGHLDTAAGVTGLIKTALAIKNRKIPPSINFNKANPQLQIEDSPFYVSTEAKDWSVSEGLRIAAVSSFGIGGTNGHVILSEATSHLQENQEEVKTSLLIFSAKSEEALQAYIDAYMSYLNETINSMRDIAFSSHTRREHFDYRLAVIAQTPKEAVEKLKNRQFLRSEGKEIITSTIEFIFTHAGGYAISPLQEKKRQVVIGPSTQWEALLNELAELYVAGAKIDWSSFHNISPGQYVHLPSYPFQRKKFLVSEIFKEKGEALRKEVSSSLAHLIKSSSSVEQKHFILNYLPLALHKVTGIESQSFQIGVPLQDYGLDSLMLAALRQEIEVDLSVALELSDIRIDRDLNELATLVALHFSQQKPTSQIEQFDTRESRVLKKAKQKKYQLFVIPPFGFGEMAYRNWSELLSDEIELIYLGYQFKGSWEDMIKEMAEKVKSVLDKPFIIYGHSLGGLVAYELVVYLENQMKFYPLSVMISSASPPVQFSRAKYSFPFNQIDEKTSSENQDLFIKAHFLPPHQMHLKMLSPEDVYADELAILHYSNSSPTSLNTPIVSIQANHDVLIPDPSLVSEWQKYTTSLYSYLEIEGSHMFFIHPPKALIDKIENVFHLTKQPFIPTVYQLKEYTQGTIPSISYPFGIEPGGLLFYDEASGSMAMHMWNRDREVRDENLDQSDIVRFMSSNFAYCGRYITHPGMVDHHINISLFSNLSGDTSSLSYLYDKEELILSTLSKTRRKQIPEYYRKWVWHPIEIKDKESAWVGSWKITQYQEDSQEIFGKNPVGQLLITSSGYFSMQIASSERKDYLDHNPALATDQELLAGYQSYRTLCGNLLHEKESYFSAEIFSPVPYLPNFTAHFSFKNELLEVSFQVKSKNNRETMIKSHWKRMLADLKQ